MAQSVRKESTRLLAFTAIKRVEDDGAYVDIVLSYLLDRSELAPRDRGFVSELVRGVQRWRGRLDWIVNALFSGKPEKLDRRVRWILWLGLYQLEYMRTPDFAAINESVKLARRLKLHKWTGVINGMLRNFARNASAISFPPKETDPVRWLAVTQSHPEWLVQQFVREFGFETAEAMCRANNQIPPISVRLNRLKHSPPPFEEMLRKHGVSFRKSIVDGFYLMEKTDYELLQSLLDAGDITVQDASAALPVLLADVQPGETVLDLCAAPGGKSTLAAEIMGDKGRILSGDANIARTGLVQQAAKRLELRSVHPVVADALHFPGKPADVVLLDAPCSGLGVLRKKPDLRWKKSAEDMVKLVAQQRQLILKAAEYVKRNGSLIYATCTISRAENEEVIDYFLHKRDDFIQEPLQKQVPENYITENGFVRTWPFKHNVDGSFAAKLMRK